ncbi:hypothetical protein LXL04_016423 [Taraxacum kok-saghyz]
MLYFLCQPLDHMLHLDHCHLSLTLHAALDLFHDWFYLLSFFDPPPPPPPQLHNCLALYEAPPRLFYFPSGSLFSLFPPSWLCRNEICLALSYSSVYSTSQ